MLDLTYADDFREMSHQNKVWSLAMMIRELATFKGTEKLVAIHELNVDGGYNHIVIETPAPGERIVIARTSSVEGIVTIDQKQFLDTTIMDLIYSLADILKLIAE